jgi:3-deoxy-D-manno-octulosonate 8-phosphate phosphatase (KDO 8-P phosphatase)
MEKMKRIRMLLLDVDGVLTDGSIIYDDSGKEIKKFSVKDGLGIRLLKLIGLEAGIVTGRASQALRHRCENLGITCICDGVRDKGAAFKVILDQTGLTPDQTAFMGDDLPDLPAMRAAGLSIAVADAHESVAAMADVVTSARGGSGAVREICEALIKAQGRWGDIEKYFL